MENNTVLGALLDPVPNPVGGNHIWIKHGSAFVVYAHFQQDTIPAALQQKGMQVRVGQMVSLAGNSRSNLTAVV
jgi:hypothetical protein